MTEASEFSKEFAQMVQQYQNRKPQKPAQITKFTPLDRNDRTQSFYRQRQASQGTSYVHRLGWKIATLTLEQQDLTFFCFSLLQSKVKYPLKIFTISHSESNSSQDSKDLWVQFGILANKSQEETSRLQVHVCELYQTKLAPIFINFMRKYMNWNEMMRQEYQDSKVISIFEGQVVTRVQEIIANSKL